MSRAHWIIVALCASACSPKPPLAPQETVYVSQNNQPASPMTPGAPPQPAFGLPQQAPPPAASSPLPPPLVPSASATVVRNDGTAQDPSRPPSGKVPNAAKVLAEVSKEFQACYKEGLKNNPEEDGSVKLTASISPTGEVASVAVSEVKGLSQAVVDCASGKLKKAKFEPPEGGVATIVVPLTFTTKQPSGK